MNTFYLPSPTQAVWQLGPLPVRAYALCILVGIATAFWLTRRRWVARGGQAPVVADVTLVAVVSGILGARLYHVVTDPQLYFAPGQNPWDALRIWDGGLGIPGALIGGGLGAWWSCRRAHVPLPVFADAVAPGIALAQALGRWGNWFNNELYGSPTSLPWRLQVHEWVSGKAAVDAEGRAVVAGYYHPTFLYESLWNVGLAGVLLLVDRRKRLRPGQLFIIYVAGYAVGRLWIEALRADPANTIAGWRVNTWVSLLALVLALTILLLRHIRTPDLSHQPSPLDRTADEARGAQHQPPQAPTASTTPLDGQPQRERPRE